MDAKSQRLSLIQSFDQGLHYALSDGPSTIVPFAAALCEA